MEGYKNLTTYILVTVICDLEEAANMLLTFCQMESYLLSKQIIALKEKFVKEGGRDESTPLFVVCPKAKALLLFCTGGRRGS